MKINNIYLDKFKRTKSSYLYPIMNGIYLAFNLEDHNYIGVEMYYQPKYRIDKYEYKTLNKLLSLGYIDII